VIDPGIAFGAGDHATTVMAMELLERAITLAKGRVSEPGLLDVGTGSGILAIAGKLLGSGLTVGLDMDPAAVFSARRNLLLNGLGAKCCSTDSVGLFVGGVDALSGSFPIVTANLVAPVLMRLQRQLTRLAGGFLILSGIYDPLREEVFDRYSSSGMNLLEVKSRADWSAALFEQACLAKNRTVRSDAGGVSA